MRRFWRNRRLLIAAAFALGFLILTVLALKIAYPRIGAWMVRSKMVPRLAAKLDRQVRVGSVEVTLGHAVLRDVVIGGPHDAPGTPLVRLDRVVVDFDILPSLVGSARVRTITVDGARAMLVRASDGSDNFADLPERLGLSKSAAAGSAPRGGGLGGLKPDTLIVRHASAEMRDTLAGVTVVIGDVAIDAANHGKAEMVMTDLVAGTAVGQEASSSRVVASADLRRGAESATVAIEDGRVSLWPGMSLTGIDGTIAATPDPTVDETGRLQIHLAGGYGGVEGELWKANGWFDPRARTAEIDLEAERFTFDRIAPVLEDTIVIDYETTAVDATMKITADVSHASFTGDFHLSDLDLFDLMAAEKPIRDLDVSGTITGDYDRAARRLRVQQSDLVSRGVPFQFDGQLELRGGVDESTGTRRLQPRVAGHLVIPPVPCKDMVAAFPPEAVPYMNGYVVGGTFNSDLRVAIDWADLEALELDEDAKNIFGCTLERSPGDIDRLRGSFEHFVEVERDQWLSFQVGPENPDFVPLEDIAPVLWKSIMTTEDSAFMSHRGFIPREFRTALIKNLKARRFSHGASSITMQLVKNVLLYREKTLSRKLQELFLTWAIEKRLGKTRILEIYLNVIEYGPALYGIGPAARRYFGKHPRDLNPVEAAFFSTILPSPKQRYRQYCNGELSKWTTGKIERVLGLMLKRGRLTQEEYDAALLMPLVFDPSGIANQQECNAIAVRAIHRARPTNPRKK